MPCFLLPLPAISLLKIQKSEKQVQRSNKMRPGRTLTSTATEITSFPPPAITQQRSPWHSPVPYLFGGLAAMLGLIAFALLILACSYWRLSGRLDDNEGGDQRDLESGNEKEGDEGKAGKIYEEKILVIMAGDQKPTFLATPVSGRASSLDEKDAKIENKEEMKTENGDKTKEDIGNHLQTTTAAIASEQLQEEEGHRETQETGQAQEQNH